MPSERPRLRDRAAWPWITALVQAIAVISVGEAGVRLELARQGEEQRALVTAHVAGTRARLESELNSTLYLSSGLVAFASSRASQLEESNVKDLLSTLYKTGRNVRNIVVAPGNRVKWVYPLQGNERVLGLYYPDNPQQWPGVKRAMERRHTIVVGPVNLVQGGRGLIARTPVFDTHGEYWGVVSLVVDWDALQQTANLQARTSQYRLAIRDVEGDRGTPIFGESAVFAERPVTARLDLPGGSWTIGAVPADGWVAPSSRIHALRLLYIAVAALIGTLAFRLVTETQRRQAALRDLARLNSELESRIDARTRELRNANDELARLVETLRRTQGELVRSEKLSALGALVAGIAHELNTPVGNSLLAASTLADKLRTLLRPGVALRRSEWEESLAQMHEASDIITRSLSRAGELISSFKQVAADRTSAQRRRFALQPTLHDLAVTMQPSLRHAGLTIEEGSIPEVELDSYPGPLDQVMMNLIQNVVQHAYPEGGPGRIRISATAAGGEVTLEIADFGVGIPAADLPRIFDPFFTTRLGQGGTGLGLHIVHNIVTGTLGGKIDVQSELGVGTRFIICLPLHAPRLPEDPA
ncbi:ATP-binding protein [Niveibacterium umoris]|nr:ATP-binding protein [Niveibacterium umoris]